MDDDVSLMFKDENGRPIGQHSISHGMRQLAATAFLWSLKETARGAFPVIVDTPLARLDRQNQDNVLRRYYPKVADQVIVLATDSEVSSEKYEIIRPHVYRTVRLHNPDGQDTSFEENALFYR